jgi:nucleotide-binding universal stress UspA family protein
MGQFRRIIVGHDLRKGGELALRSSVVLAKQCDAAVRLVHVVEPPHFYQKIPHPSCSQNNFAATVQKAGAKLREIVACRKFAHLQMEYETRTGKTCAELILASRAWRADLLVVGGPSQQEHHLITGSTSERVIRKSPVPVLSAPQPLAQKVKRILVPTDFSRGARRAAEKALALARSSNGRIFFLHVLEPLPPYAYAFDDGIASSLAIPPVTPADMNPEWESFLSALPLRNIPWKKRTEEGRASSAIVHHAAAIHADLIVMGTHGKSALEHMLLGGVAEAVVRAMPCPVLTVRPEALRCKVP